MSWFLEILFIAVNNISCGNGVVVIKLSILLFNDSEQDWEIGGIVKLC